MQEPVLLEHVEVYRGVRSVAKLECLGVPRQANDLVRPIAAEPAATSRVPVDRYLLADGIEAGEIVPRHRLIDDRHAWPPHIPETEIASGDQRYSKRLEISRRDKRHRRPETIAGQLHVAFREQETT